MMFIVDNQLPLLILFFLAGFIATAFIFRKPAGHLAWKIADLLWVVLGGIGAVTAVVAGLYAADSSRLDRQIDVAFVDMIATPKRAVTVSFTDSYFSPEGVMLVNSNSDLETWDDLNQAGKTIVALAGTATELAARTNFPNAEVRPMVADGEAALLLEVTGGRADATITANVNAGLYLSQNPNAPLELLEDGRGIPSQGYSYAVRPADAHLRAFLNTFVNSANDTGLRDEMEQKWIFNFPG